MGNEPMEEVEECGEKTVLWRYDGGREMSRMATIESHARNG